MIGSCDHCYDGPCISSTKNPGYCTNKAETEICSSTGSAFVKCEVNYKGCFFLKKYKFNMQKLNIFNWILIRKNAFHVTTSKILPFQQHCQQIKYQINEIIINRR